jgi:hypothetical protein
MSDSIERLSFELSTSALAEQERRLAGLRVSAGTVLASGSVAGSFLGAGATRGVLATLALAFYSLCLVGSIWVLMPHDLAFGFQGEDVMRTRAGERHSGTRSAYLAAAFWIERHLELKDEKLSMLSTMLTISCVMLGCEILAWTFDIAR